MTSIEPTGREFALFFKPIDIELRKYEAEPSYEPSKSQIKNFQRSCVLLKECPILTTRPRATRIRIQSAHENVQKLYRELEPDLFILCTLTTSPTKISSLLPQWIARLHNWWNSVSKPPRLTEIAHGLCEDCGLPPRQQKDHAVAQNADRSMTCLPNIDSELGLVTEVFSEPYQHHTAHITNNLRVPVQQTIGNLTILCYFSAFFFF